MKTALLSFFLLSTCVSSGDRWDYTMARGRTSGVIKNATAVATVLDSDDDETTFRVDLWVKPILGAARESRVERTVPSSILSADTLARLREEGEIVGEDFRVTYVGAESPCDWVKIDQLPDTDEAQDMVIGAKVCSDGVPMVNLDFKSQGRQLKLGLDRQ